MPAKKRKGTEFSPATKAEIYVRDRATCAFSGKSLWILDYGISPIYDVDWADHRTPRSRGGSSEAENGICASSFHNSKKSSNGRDNCFLFDEGEPTSDFFWNIGILSSEVLSQLKRLSNLRPCDWYFNRAIHHLFLAADWLHYDRKYARDVDYYKKAARTALANYQLLRCRNGVEKIENRGLVLHTDQKDVKLLLKLQDSSDDQLLHEIIRIYRANLGIMDDFSEGEDIESLSRVLSKAFENPDASPRIVEVLQSQFEFWKFQYSQPNYK